MPYAGLNDLNMFYEEFGKGDALLFLHSHFSRSLLAFSTQIIPFQRHYHCFFPIFVGMAVRSAKASTGIAAK